MHVRKHVRNHVRNTPRIHRRKNKEQTGTPPPPCPTLPCLLLPYVSLMPCHDGLTPAPRWHPGAPPPHEQAAGRSSVRSIPPFSHLPCQPRSARGGAHRHRAAAVRRKERGRDEMWRWVAAVVPQGKEWTKDLTGGAWVGWGLLGLVAIQELTEGVFGQCAQVR